MNRVCALVVAVCVVLGGRGASAEEPSRYRSYVLESSLASVTEALGTRSAAARTLHERPARIQEIEWRAPYSGLSGHADPVRAITFTFFDDALYQLVVSYDHDRTDGLSNAELVESVSSVYGSPVAPSVKSLPATHANRVLVARWETAADAVMLLRGKYSLDVELILVSTALSARATTAIREAQRLDTIEAPARESARQKKDLADARAALDKQRATNKAAFRP